MQRSTLHTHSTAHPLWRTVSQQTLCCWCSCMLWYPKQESDHRAADTAAGQGMVAQADVEMGVLVQDQVGMVMGMERTVQVGMHLAPLARSRAAGACRRRSHCN